MVLASWLFGCCLPPLGDRGMLGRGRVGIRDGFCQALPIVCTVLLPMQTRGPDSWLMLARQPAMLEAKLLAASSPFSSGDWWRAWTELKKEVDVFNIMKPWIENYKFSINSHVWCQLYLFSCVRCLYCSNTNLVPCFKYYIVTVSFTWRNVIKTFNFSHHLLQILGLGWFICIPFIQLPDISLGNFR